MQITVRPIAPAAPVPVAQPLTQLNPAQLDPSSGVLAYSEGLRQGEKIGGPISDEINDLGNYFSPQERALRETRIASAALATTNAKQMNEAALETPDLPLAERQKAAAAAAADINAIPVEGQARVAKAGQVVAEMPSQTQADINAAILRSAAAKGGLENIPAETALKSKQLEEAQKAEINKISTTPDYSQPLSQADNASAVDAAMNEARTNARVGLASNPYLSGGPNGTAALPEGWYLSGGKAIQDEPSYRDVLGEDGKTIYSQAVWKHSGQPVSSIAPVVAGSNARIQAANDRQDKSIGARSVDIGDGVVLTPGENTTVNRVVSDFAKRSDITGIVKVVPMFQKVFAVLNSRKDATTGLPDVDAMNQAAYIFRNGKITDSEMKQLDSAGGIKQHIFQLWNAWDGKKYDPETIKDMVNALTEAKNAGETYLGKIENDFTKALPKNAKAAAPNLFNRVAHLEGAPTLPTEALAGATNSPVTPQQPAPITESHDPDLSAKIGQLKSGQQIIIDGKSYTKP